MKRAGYRICSVVRHFFIFEQNADQVSPVSDSGGDARSADGKKLTATAGPDVYEEKTFWERREREDVVRRKDGEDRKEADSPLPCRSSGTAEEGIVNESVRRGDVRLHGAFCLHVMTCRDVRGRA